MNDALANNPLKIENINFWRKDKRLICSFSVTIPQDAALDEATLFGRPYFPFQAKAIGSHIRAYFKGLDADISASSSGTTRLNLTPYDDILSFSITDLRLALHMRGLVQEVGLRFKNTAGEVTAQKLLPEEFPKVPRSYADFVAELNQFVAAKIA